MIGEREFRSIMGHFATGVTVVTSRDGKGEPVGLTVNALTSVSLRPLLLLACVHKASSAHDPLLGNGFFGVNVLSSEQEILAAQFASGEARDRFRGVPWSEGARGSPLLVGALAWLECRVYQVYPGGDHSIVVGEVLAGGVGAGDPLLFFRGELLGGGGR